MKDDRLYLHHMLERCDRITRFIGPGREAFYGIRGIAGRGDPKRRSDWLDIARLEGDLRHARRLIHAYIGMDLDEVWNVACSRIPELLRVLEQFLGDDIPGSTPVR